MNDIEFNVTFHGEYSLLKKILMKYKKELPYEGSVMTFVDSLPYALGSTGNNWNKYGVPVRVWNCLHKDLTIARLMGRIKEGDIRTLEELRIELEGGDLSSGTQAFCD